MSANFKHISRPQSPNQTPSICFNGTTSQHNDMILIPSINSLIPHQLHLTK